MQIAGARDSISRSFATTIAGLQQLSARFESDPEFAASLVEAVEIIGNRSGRVIVTGVGKSGHIGRKIAATMASTGTPAYFVHPTEASHGDLGMIESDDVIICLSWSGETIELGGTLNYAKRFRVPLIAVTSNANSMLARNATVAITLPKVPETCPHGLAPTTSTTVQLVIGDALAIALLERRGFTPTDFRVFHPGGKLGAQLVLVMELAHTGAEMPLLPVGALMSEAILTISAKGFGVVGVTGEGGRLVGIVTDGDLRRHMRGDLLQARIETVMSARPRTVRADALASAAMEMMEAAKITALFIVDADGLPIGLLHIHDLLHAGVA